MEATITKLTPEIMAEIEEMRVKLNALRKMGVIGICTYFPEVHINEDLFDANFPNIEAEPNEHDIFQYKKSVVINGVKYFSLYREVQP